MQNLSFHIQKTKAILVGVGNYSFLPKIGPALRNIDDVAGILADKNIIGLPEENILRITDKRHDEISDEIDEFLNKEENLGIETLIFYYAGHGIREAGNKEFYLTGINTKKNTPKVSAIPFS